MRIACWLCSVAVVVGAFGVLAGPANADTTVSGDRDANAPLVIDPASNPTDPLVVDQLVSNLTLAFIQRMPVTKVVNEITVGDLGQWSGCATPTTTRIFVREHPGAGELGSELNDSQQIVYSLTTNAMPATLGTITYTIPPTTFRKGRGYSIRLQATDCSHVRLRSWEHNAPIVNGGPDICTEAPNGKRLWHVSGLDDSNWECVNRLPGARSFDPSMPTGWLASRLAGTSQDITWGFHAPGGSSVCDTAANPDPFALGAQEHYWRHRAGKTNPDWVCIWSQFADHGMTVPDGWYYALPWRVERTGAPRDVYVKFDTIDYDALLGTYSPIVAYDSTESFRALSPSAATDFFDASDDPDDPNDANRLMDGDGAFASANSSVAASTGIDNLGLGYLSDSYPNGLGPRSGTSASVGDYLSYRGSSSLAYVEDASAIEGLPGYGNQTYGRVVHDSSGHLWLQYWIYYYFDPQVNFLGSGQHEGDWEMVQLRLSSGAPDMAAYAQHGGGEVCPWNEVAVSGQRPIVYVAGDSHASYFRPGAYTDPSPDERADGSGGVTQPDLNQIRLEDVDWLRWPGSWGDSGASPDGPAFQGTKWTDPGAWAGSLSPCDVS